MFDLGQLLSFLYFYLYQTLKGAAYKYLSVVILGTIIGRPSTAAGSLLTYILIFFPKSFLNHSNRKDYCYGFEQIRKKYKFNEKVLKYLSKSPVAKLYLD